MDPVIADYLESLEIGDLQRFSNMAVAPLRAEKEFGPQYITLHKALEEHALAVTEVNEGGSVPELKVVNKSEKCVLLLDGEELAGAKQNRVLNTTILLKKRSETIIPVSCTEHGRWSYNSDRFRDSGVVMSPSVRSRKTRSVSESLRSDAGYRSDQGEVWNCVAAMARGAATHSPTGAMRDVFAGRGADLEDYLKAFDCVDGQHGLLVMVNNKVVGLDVVSRASAYAQIHGKLVKSYAMDALLQRGKRNPKPDADLTGAFIQAALECEHERHNSVGHGWDYRFHGPGIVGSALVYRKATVHATFFRAAQSDQAGPMAGSRRRRDFRVR